MEKYSRWLSLIDQQQLAKLNNSFVLVFGLGGVGGYVVENLVRCGIGRLTLVDGDKVEVSNFNRQIIAVEENIGKLKTEVFQKRIKSINPDCRVELISKFILAEDITDFDFSPYDYIVDAIDTVSTKLAIIAKAKQENKAVISAMGFGNKLDPSKITVADIKESSVCPLARVIRQELRKRAIEEVKVVFSKEQPRQPNKDILGDGRKNTVGSFAPVVSAAGALLAAEVICDLLK